MRKVAIALFILVCTSQALADWTQIRSTDFFLNPPPVAGSRAYREDFRVLHELQDTRDPRDCRLAQLQRIPTFDVFYGATAGLFSKAELDSARPVLSRVFKFSERAADYQKGKFGRPRPYSVDPTLHPCAHMPEGARAYPSSHAVLAVVGSCVLAPESAMDSRPHAMMPPACSSPSLAPSKLTGAISRI